MAQKVTLLNGVTIERDTDYTAFAQHVLRTGIVSGLEVTNGSVSAGIGFIKVTRNATTPSEDILVKYENTTAVSIDTSGDKKVWVEINQDNVNDPGLNVADGTGVGSIQTGASFPSSNYIPLASITAGTITDLREYNVVTLKARSITGNEVFLDAPTNDIIRVLTQAGALAKFEGADFRLNGVGVGLANGLAVLNANGKIPSANIDVIPSAAMSTQVQVGEDITNRNVLRRGRGDIITEVSVVQNSTILLNTTQTDIFSIVTPDDDLTRTVNEITVRGGGLSGSGTEMTLYITDTSNNVLYTSTTETFPYDTGQNTLLSLSFTGVVLQPNTTYKVRAAASVQNRVILRYGSSNNYDRRYNLIATENSEKFFKASASDTALIKHLGF